MRGMAQNYWGGSPPIRCEFTLSSIEGRSRRLGEGQGRLREVGSGGSPSQKREATNLPISGSLEGSREASPYADYAPKNSLTLSDDRVHN